MTYCSGSLYRNTSCGCSNNNNNNTGAGCVCDNNGNCTCSNGIGGNNTCGCTNRPACPFPPRPSCNSCCPPGTFPCPCRPPYYNPCCGCNGNGNPQNPVGSFAFLNSSGTTLTSGSIVPLRYVLGTGNLARNTAGGVVSLDSGAYAVSYSVNGVIPDSGVTVTITPEYGGAVHPELSRSFTSVGTDGSFEVSGIFGVTLPTDTTLSLNATVTGTEAEATATGVNASMLITKVGNSLS